MCDTVTYLYVCSQINNKDELIHQLREDLECLNRQQKETTAKVKSKKKTKVCYCTTDTTSDTKLSPESYCWGLRSQKVGEEGDCA